MKHTSPSTPPVWVMRILNCLLPEHQRECILGDLQEEGQSIGAGAWWYWLQAITIAAHFAFTSKKQRKQNSEKSSGDGFMTTLWNDIRFGARMLRKTPLFTFIAVLTLAVGIGATTAIFGIVNALLIQPLPLPNADRLVAIGGRDANGRPQYVSFPDFEDIQKRTRNSFVGFSAFVPQSVNLTGRSEPRRVRGGFVSDNFFQLIGVQPALGRSFNPGVDDREGADRVCIVQYETWQNVFGADSNLLGSSLELNNEDFTVVGILPKGFRFPFDEVEVWIPHHDWPYYRNALKDGSIRSRSEGAVAPIAALKPGATLVQARKEISFVFQQLSTQYPEGGKRSAVVKTLQEVVVRDVRQIVLVILGAVIFVLLIACANVANLLLSRAASRHRELATRAALGAGRKRLVAQLFTETALIWLAGCIGGLFIGRWGLSLLMAAAPGDLPGGIVARIDLHVFCFAFAITTFTSILFGLIPALRFSAPNVIDAIKDGAHGQGSTAHVRLRTAMVAGQIALTLVLLVGSALLLRSLQQLTSVHLGFQPQNLLTMEYRLPLNKYPQPAQQWQVHHQIIERIRQLPGVLNAALIRGLPFSGNGGMINFEIPGRPAGKESLRARMNLSSTDYFQTMRIPLLRGRTFSDEDRAETPLVVIVNQYLVNHYFPGQDPMGKMLRLKDSSQTMTAKIIGIVGNTKHSGLDDPEMGYIYAAQAQNPGIFNTIVVRTAGDPMLMANAVKRAVWSIDPEQPVWKIRTQEFLIERSVGLPKFISRLMSVYAAIALLLAIVGIYGVMSYSVDQRTYEIGVRMALGAEPSNVLRLVLRHGLLITCAGLILGVIGSLALGRAIQSLLFQTSASDPVTLAFMATVMGVVAVIASYLPARRATRVDPLLSLRYE